MCRTPAAKSSLGHHTWVGQRQEGPSWWDKDFRECVLSGDPECQVGGNRTELQLSYFCGYGPGCSDAGNVSALQMAMRAVEQEYSVVGVVEDRNRSLAVMEAFMPRWFQGLFSLQGEGTGKKEMVNPHPEPVEGGKEGPEAETQSGLHLLPVGLPETRHTVEEFTEQRIDK